MTHRSSIGGVPPGKAGEEPKGHVQTTWTNEEEGVAQMIKRQKLQFLS